MRLFFWVEIRYANDFSNCYLKCMHWPVQLDVLLVLICLKTPHFLNFLELSFRKIIPRLQAHRWSDFALALKL